MERTNKTPVLVNGIPKGDSGKPDRVIQRNSYRANSPGRKGAKARARIVRAAKRRGIVIEWR